MRCFVLEPEHVAVALPALPAYHGPAMQLSVDIDRGSAGRRPALIVYTAAGDRRIPLARWPTTVGGWQLEQGDDLVRRWKASPVGPRIWRDLYVGPSWIPPATTPDRELVRAAGGRYALARELLGPSYRAAFGLIAFVHLVEERTRSGAVTWDQGIRTHGTGNLASIADGASHGCHRLLGLHVVRLAGFVIAHREHVRRGDTRTYYRRVVSHGGHFPIAIDSLGYRIELASPIPSRSCPAPCLADRDGRSPRSAASFARARHADAAPAGVPAPAPLDRWRDACVQLPV